MNRRSLTETLRETLRCFDPTGTPLTTTEVADQFDLSRRSAYERLDRLVGQGYLDTKKVGASARVWWRPPDGVQEPLSGGVTGQRAKTKLTSTLENTRHCYQTLIEHFPDGTISLVDQTLRYAIVGGTPIRTAETTTDGLEGNRLREVLPAEVADVVVGHYEAALDGEASTFEVEIDDRTRRFHIRPIRDEEGAVYAAMGTSQDVTEYKQRERELEQYETIVDAIDDGIYVLDEAYHFQEVNDAYVEMTGYSREELVGSHCSLVVGEDVSTRAAVSSRTLAAGAEQRATIEAEIHRADGSRLPAESRFTARTSEDGTFEGTVGVVRDISDRRQRERALQHRIRQQEVVAELGRSALAADQDIDTLLADAAEMVAETLDTAYCKVLDLDDAEELLLRQGVGWNSGVVGTATVSAVDDESQAAYTLRTNQPVVVADLRSESRFSGPALLTDHGIVSGISVLIGSTDDPWGILGVHDVARREFSDHDATFVQSVANVLASAIARGDYEQTLVHQREQLAALNNVNEVVRKTTESVIDQSTRERIEETVCEHLASSESYQFAWIGEVDTTSQTVRLRTEAGVEGYLDDVTITDPEAEHGRGPTGLALRTGEVQTVQDALAETKYDSWREQATTYGFRSTAAIPIVHEENVYGVLNIYTERPRAFEGWERAVIAQLGGIVGHAIAATERKRALQSDEVVELEFAADGFLDALGTDTDPTGTITFNNAVPLGEEEFLVYGRATADAVGDVRTLVDTLPHWEGVTFRDTSDESTEFEIRLSEPPILSIVASAGGTVEEAVLEDGDFRMTIQISPSTDVRDIVELVEDVYPTARLLCQRQITRDRRSFDRVQRILTAELTARQRATLATAYYTGFFEWPRGATGEEVAETLGLASSTFHQHLRKAERKVVEQLFTTSTPFSP